MTANPFDIKALSDRVSALGKQIDNPYLWEYERRPLRNELEKTQTELGVAEQYQNDVMAANRSSNQQINAAALGRARRAAGGGTFKRRGSAVSANQLVNNLGTANAKALAETRRAKALADVAVSQAQRQAEQARIDAQQKWGFVNGPPILTIYR